MVMSSWDWNGGRDPYRNLRSAVERLFSEFAQENPAWGAAGAVVWPPINVWEENDGFVLEAELPGIKMEQIEITCQGRDLTLRGERKDPGDPDENYQRRERFAGSFIRSLTLPADIDADKVRATLDDGVLRIQIPKSESAKPRRIDVKPSSGKEPVKTTSE
jgi:HSP20 family protein